MRKIVYICLVFFCISKAQEVSPKIYFLDNEGGFGSYFVPDSVEYIQMFSAPRVRIYSISSNKNKVIISERYESRNYMYYLYNVEMNKITNLSKKFSWKNNMDFSFTLDGSHLLSIESPSFSNKIKKECHAFTVINVETFTSIVKGCIEDIAKTQPQRIIGITSYWLVDKSGFIVNVYDGKESHAFVKKINSSDIIQVDSVYYGGLFEVRFYANNELFHIVNNIFENSLSRTKVSKSRDMSYLAFVDANKLFCKNGKDSTLLGTVNPYPEDQAAFYGWLDYYLFYKIEQDIFVFNAKKGTIQKIEVLSKSIITGFFGDFYNGNDNSYQIAR